MLFKIDAERTMGSEDVGIFSNQAFKRRQEHPRWSTTAWVPWDLITLAAAQSKGTLPPGMHTSRFAPCPSPRWLRA